MALKFSQILLSISLILNFTKVFSQVEYIAPSPIQKVNYTIIIKDLVAEKDFSKFKIILKNTSSDSYLNFDYTKVVFVFPDGQEYFAKEGSKNKFIAVAPNSSESKVITIKGNSGFDVNQYTLKIEGLSMGKLPSDAVLIKDPINIGAESKKQTMLDFDIEPKEFKSNKTELKGIIEISSNTESDALIVFEPSKIKVYDNNNNTLTYKTSTDKTIALSSGVKDDFKLTATTTESSVKLNVSDCFKYVNLTKESIKPISIKSTKFVANTEQVVATKIETVVNNNTETKKPQATTQNSTSNTTQYCEAIILNKTAPVKITIYNASGHCFSLISNGAKLTTQPTSNLIAYMDYGKKTVNFSIDNKYSFEDKINLPSSLESVEYELKQNKKGEWELDRSNIKMNQAAANSLNAFAKANEKRSDEFQKEQSNSLNEFEKENKKKLEKYNEKETNSSSSNNTVVSTTVGNSNGTNSINNNKDIYTFKFLYNGNPVKSVQVEVKNGDHLVGTGTTNNNGEMTINRNNLVSDIVDFYFEKNKQTCNIRGTWKVESKLNFEEVPIDKLLKKMIGSDGISMSAFDIIFE